MAKNTDLHTHSCYSDGLLSPKELVRLAKKRGVKNLALTDHDSVKGVKEAITEGKKIGVNIIPSIEIRVDSGEVLGYFIDVKNKELIKKLKQQNKRIEAHVKAWCKKLNKAGYPVSFKEIQKKFPKAKGNINGFYPIYMLHLKGYGATIIGILNKLRKDKRIHHKEVKCMPMLRAIKLIRKAGGVPVLAHPWVVSDTKKIFKNMKAFVKAGLKGIELNNGDRAPFKPRGTDKKIRKAAKKYKLILTSGSDYHGKEIVKMMPGNHNLGKNNCDEKVVEKLRRLAKEF